MNQNEYTLGWHIIKTGVCTACWKNAAKFRSLKKGDTIGPTAIHHTEWVETNEGRLTPKMVMAEQDHEPVVKRWLYWREDK